jgi:hypothetical protein
MKDLHPSQGESNKSIEENDKKFYLSSNFENIYIINILILFYNYSLFFQLRIIYSQDDLLIFLQ